MQLVSYEFEYFYLCIMTFGGLRDSKGPRDTSNPFSSKLMILTQRGFFNLFGEFSLLWGDAVAPLMRPLNATQ